MTQPIIKKIGKNRVFQYSTSGDLLMPEQILSSWSAVSFSFPNGDDDSTNKGFRTAQLGAIYAIKAHWTVSSAPATIVMPTGTGKTETIIAAILSERRKKTCIVVPSQLLRNQTIEKCGLLYVLRNIGAVPSDYMNPSIGCLTTTPSTINELLELITTSNIIVSTASLLSRFDKNYSEYLSNKCDTSQIRR